ncbi:glycosyltransferase, partial [bacterium]|nr:glycosyltransferase [bacterium]
LISAFYYASDFIFWMSEAQRNVYWEKFPFLQQHKQLILSSVFDKEFVAYIRSVQAIDKIENCVVLGSDSWIKGQDDAINYCQQNNLKFEILKNLQYQQLLSKLELASDFVYLPKGGDTCPRMVIEAKLLNCKLHINDNVQHAKEAWFQQDNASILEYLEKRPAAFWEALRKFIHQDFQLSGYSTTYNCVNQNYPFVESITSMLDFCDEVVVVDGGSTDGTIDVLQSIASDNSKLKIFINEKNWNDERFAVYDGEQKAFARSKCIGDFCWQQDVDEVVNENDYEKIRFFMKNLHKSNQLVSFPVVEFWGSKGKIRLDVNPWKWRLSRNYFHITHGIPKQFRQYDKSGLLYAAPGSDGCDYIHKFTFEIIPCNNFFNEKFQKLRENSVVSSVMRKKYENELNQCLIDMPTVYHYSWFNIERKIKLYKDYWSKHWNNLFGGNQNDIAENNMFFDKPWKDVTDEDIHGLAIKLEADMCGWIFHKKIDWNKKLPSLNLSISHPDIMKEWMQENA